MGYNKDQFRGFITRTLKELAEETEDKIPFSEESVDLLMMTAAHESHLGTYLKQVKGPAKGPFQMEPTTHEDHWRYITPRNWLYTALCKMNLECDAVEDALEYNLKYSVVMARVHYFRKPEALPVNQGANYYIELSEYAKEHYNTFLGKAKAYDYLTDYFEYCR